MGLISVCPVRTFLETQEAACVESQAEILLSAFFAAMRATHVHMSLSAGAVMKAFVESKAQGSFFTSTAYLDALAKPVKHEVLPASIAARQGAIRMAQLPQPSRISTGISFGLDQEPVSPRTSWSLMFHRGPLPMLELRLTDQTGFKPPAGWADCLLEKRAVHMVTTTRSHLGSADHLYLFVKGKAIFPHSRGESSAEAASAGRSLRQFCRELTSGQAATTNRPSRLSFWRWKQKRFVRKFDKALTNHVGGHQLSTVLEAMGTSPTEWFQVC